MRKTLLINPKKCTGCRTCELVCSLEHTDEFNPSLSRVTMINFPEEIITIPVTCLHCQEPSCKNVCPTGAIERDKETGAVVIVDEKCIGCNMCLMVCHIGAISTVEQERLEYNVKCNLCDGEPECVEFCPTGALEFGRPDDMLLTRKKKVANQLRSLIEEAI
ncbi:MULTISPECIES: 4Fe-4S dicluster domain-containing protein [unclassified Candidatus Frackibacter]|uniref:4Fe-4S dicluster domain-containing protein n=1 Tax=unclassified Candidatus Frackibacter TaxID=2648818 RepID=UPI00079A57CC|nr:MULTISPECIES: 4Fe-4S dicluster domain-containing protein [unclassified Candidatus Frackibacter]KXS41737.1 MAG: 4Fe-4S ferredoxin [Candidatus Frackibacter sp. T328-2]SDC78671.1 Fe-S-cluster-containing hydrogenase component 2 [Candidatus Frackibacter sp. WG11]SEM91476.1 Fe-S-cluster-containing hydrogenase component 2 [Candidatus Frackibacter sp. WG12]SFM01280.1 Fe-S-cluster-containing hydrogenase component 2 [Candidatus Frackibacter sp. WG13]